MRTLKPSRCRRARPGSRLISRCDIENSSFLGLDRLTFGEFTVRTVFIAAFAVGDGEEHIRAGRRVIKRKGDDLAEGQLSVLVHRLLAAVDDDGDGLLV